MSETTLRHAWLRALGAQELPEQITLSDGTYTRLRTYKHDFFAATGLYRGPSGKAILKVSRTAPLRGIPTRRLGKFLAQRECLIYDAVDDLSGVPRCLGAYGDTGFVHVFVEGHPLQKHERVSDTFFTELGQLLDALHQRGIAYVDLEKRENILVGDDGRPYLIDFQISFRWQPGARRTGMMRLIPEELGRFILRKLQEGDRYHLLKHTRRHRPDLLTPEQYKASYRTGLPVQIHRRVTRPLTAIRRAALLRLTGRARSPKQDGPEFLMSE